jgi:hypothetical protein
MTENAPTTQEPSKPKSHGDGYKNKCEKLPDPPPIPELPPVKECPQPCCCPQPPGGPPSNCLDDLIKSQTRIVKKADRANDFVKELTAIQGDVTTALGTYTQARYKELLKAWLEQDKAIVELVRKLVCAVPCWECLLECRLCPQLTEIRRLEDRLNGTGELTTQVFSLLDLQYWHQRNVFNMQGRVDRIKNVAAAWKDPSGALGTALEADAKLIEDTQKIIATDSAKAVYDIFMTLIPRHWAIRPRDGDAAHASKIDMRFVHICECSQGNKDCACDDGDPDDCCGPDVGILTLRQRLVGPLPYIVDPAQFPDIICCLTRERLRPASDQLADAQAELAAATDDVQKTQALIGDKTKAIETTFRAELPNPIDCKDYTPKKKPPQQQPPQGGGNCGPEQTQPEGAQPRAR